MTRPTRDRLEIPPPGPVSMYYERETGRTRERERETETERDIDRERERESERERIDDACRHPGVEIPPSDNLLCQYVLGK